MRCISNLRSRGCRPSDSPKSNHPFDSSGLSTSTRDMMGCPESSVTDSSEGRKASKSGLMEGSESNQNKSPSCIDRILEAKGMRNGIADSLVAASWRTKTSMVQPAVRERRKSRDFKLLVTLIRRHRDGEEWPTLYQCQQTSMSLTHFIHVLGPSGSPKSVAKLSGSSRSATIAKTDVRSSFGRRIMGAVLGSSTFEDLKGLQRWLVSHSKINIVRGLT